MKKILSTIFFSLCFLLSFSQKFEGKIIYSNSYTSKNNQVSSEQWNGMLGTRQEYLIKDGNYRSSTNGTVFQWQLYIGKENKLYTKVASSPVLLWSDAFINNDEIIKTELNKNVITVLGYSCDELIFTCKNSVQKFYFAAKPSVNAKLFARHKLGNFSAYLSETNALPLKSVTETGDFIMEAVAQEIIPANLSTTVFEIASGTKTEKSPY